jgi:hypothetical protein
MMCNENKVTWEDYKKVEKELDEMYIKYATATTASVRMLCACAIEEYRKTLSLMKASLNRRVEGKVKNNNPIRSFFSKI